MNKIVILGHIFFIIAYTSFMTFLMSIFMLQGIVKSELLRNIVDILIVTVLSSFLGGVGIYLYLEHRILSVDKETSFHREIFAMLTNNFLILTFVIILFMLSLNFEIYFSLPILLVYILSLIFWISTKFKKKK